MHSSKTAIVSGCSTIAFASFYGDTTITMSTAGYHRRSILLIGRFKLRDRPKCWCRAEWCWKLPRCRGAQGCQDFLASGGHMIGATLMRRRAHIHIHVRTFRATHRRQTEELTLVALHKNGTFQLSYRDYRSFRLYHDTNTITQAIKHNQQIQKNRMPTLFVESPRSPEPLLTTTKQISAKTGSAACARTLTR